MFFKTAGLVLIVGFFCVTSWGSISIAAEQTTGDTRSAGEILSDSRENMENTAETALTDTTASVSDSAQGVVENTTTTVSDSVSSGVEDAADAINATTNKFFKGLFGGSKKND